MEYAAAQQYEYDGNAASPLAQSWRVMSTCKLCWSVTFSVFLMILAIESIILVPSALNFHSNELVRLEEKAAATVGAALTI